MFSFAQYWAASVAFWLAKTKSSSVQGPGAIGHIDKCVIVCSVPQWQETSWSLRYLHFSVLSLGLPTRTFTLVIRYYVLVICVNVIKLFEQERYLVVVRFSSSSVYCASRPKWQKHFLLLNCGSTIWTNLKSCVIWCNIFSLTISRGWPCILVKWCLSQIEVKYKCLFIYFFMHLKWLWSVNNIK